MKFRTCALLFHRANYFLRGTFLNSHPSISISPRKFSQWHIVGAVCLERKPVITQPLTPLEQRYFEYLQKLEVEKSYLSDHEKRQIDDMKIKQKLESGDLDDMDAAVKQTAQDFEDASLDDFKKYKPSPRITDADKNNDQRSIQRKLDSTLLLAVKQKLGNDHRWILPQTVHEEGETLIQTAERALNNISSQQLKVQFCGNAPVGYYKYKYPKVIRGNGVCGAKVFFFKAQLLPHKQNAIDLKQNDTVSDYLWLTHSELENFLQPVYCKVVQSFLLPDTLDMNVSDVYQQYSTDDDERLASSA